jgi:hypothetical protein
MVVDQHGTTSTPSRRWAPGQAARLVRVAVTAALLAGVAAGPLVGALTGRPADATPSRDATPARDAATAGTAGTARAASGRMKVYFGTTHTHTGAGNDHGDDGSGSAAVFRTARRNGFDFVVLTEHAGPTGPRNPAVFFSRAVANVKRFTEDGVFVGLAGYEYTENNGDDDHDNGHLTAFGTRKFVDASARGMWYTQFWRYLVAQSRRRDVFAGFNHPPARGHDAATTPDSAALRRVVALSETSNKVRYDREDEAGFYRAFVRALDRGWRVAPTCGLDSHGLHGMRQQETDHKKPCRAGVLLRSLSADALVAAIRARRVYSTRDTNLRAWYRANGSWMGSRIPAEEEVELSIVVKDPDVEEKTDEIRRIEVIGEGGRVVAAHSFSDHAVRWRPEVRAGDNGYLFVRVFTGERSAHTAVLAPVWLR